MRSLSLLDHSSVACRNRKASGLGLSERIVFWSMVLKVNGPAERATLFLATLAALITASFQSALMV